MRVIFCMTNIFPYCELFVLIQFLRKVFQKIVIKEVGNFHE